ncbi:hypothetical protein [Kitasatospora sp. HPMI-4]|uniref:hypothetical protein n=1 Tax=Kitasatospora sp. HPMI-4 TaxID=3448443 RepID=UPI003F1C58A7
MALIILLELVEPADARVLQATGESPDQLAVRRVHAAVADPDVPGDPGSDTLCGADTSAMITERWSAGRPGQRWPPRWRGWICSDCDAVLRSAP